MHFWGGLGLCATNSEFLRLPEEIVNSIADVLVADPAAHQGETCDERGRESSHGDAIEEAVDGTLTNVFIRVKCPRTSKLFVGFLWVVDGQAHEVATRIVRDSGQNL